MALRIGLIGGFQGGKSTLINCLLENRVAVTGIGLSTTKYLVEYYYSPRVRFSEVCGAREKDLFMDQFLHSAPPKTDVVYRIGLPSPLLQSVSLIDTPGFDAEERDDRIAEKGFADLDFAIFVLGGTRGALNKPECATLYKLSEYRIPVLIVFNSHGDTDVQWDPSSQINCLLRKNVSAQIKQMGLMRCIPLCGEDVFAINTAWCWYAISEQRGHDFLLPEAKREKALKRSVRIFFAGEEDISEKQLMERSRIGILREFLTEGGTMFGNVHTTTAIYNAFDDMCMQIVRSMEMICSRSAKPLERFKY